MMEKTSAGILFSSDICVTTVIATARNRPRSLAVIVINLPRLRAETALAHQCKPSNSSVILPSLKGTALVSPRKAVAPNARTSTIGCVSMTQIATGTARSSTQSKDARACPNGPVLFVPGSSDEFMPLLLSSHKMNRQIIGLDVFAVIGITCKHEVDGSASHTQVL